MQLGLFGPRDFMFKDREENLGGLLIRHPAAPDEAVADEVTLNIIESVPDGLTMSVPEFLPTEGDKQ
jgi:hypothetical protein